ncbi:MAG: DNA glycosylase [Lachnospiraceae bacterium]|nr:DNA glycosylase [Lachnospiraceae bacterium]
MINIEKQYFSLKQISESGQCFRLEQLGNERYGLTALGRYLEAQENQEEISFFCSREEFESVWKDYFDLGRDYGKIIACVEEEDDYLRKAVCYGSGIRILKQDLWEMIISFIISQQNNIKRIRKCIDYLCRKYGEEKRTEEGKIYYTFPSPEKLANVPLEDLYACNLGYRSRYIQKTARSVAEGELDLRIVQSMEYDVAKSELLKLYGIGEKVADCICLFALHQLDAFPRDTHINKVLERQYTEGFPFEKYRGFAGVLQQYIFYYDLKN